MDRLLETIKQYLPPGPQYYPADQITDHPERFIITELIREKVLHLTREEVPHSVAVVMEKMEQKEMELFMLWQRLLLKELTKRNYNRETRKDAERNR